MQAGRARGLEEHGVRTSRPFTGICRPRRCTSTRFGATKGSWPPDGPLVCRTGAHTGRSPNDKFVVKEPSSEAHIAWGKVNKPIDQAQFDALKRDMLAHLADARAVRAGPVRRRRSGLSPAGSVHPGARLAEPVRPQPVHRAARRATCAGFDAAVHRHHRAELQGRPGAARHALRRRDRRSTWARAKC